MGVNRKNPNAGEGMVKLFSCLGSVKGVEKGAEKKEDEKVALWTTGVGAGGIMRNKKKKNTRTRRRVQWKDSNGGNKLVEVLEYEPSDSSDSEDELLDTCLCVIA